MNNDDITTLKLYLEEIMFLLKGIRISTEKRLNTIIWLLLILVLIFSIFAITICYCNYLN